MGSNFNALFSCGLGLHARIGLQQKNLQLPYTTDFFSSIKGKKKKKKPPMTMTNEKKISAVRKMNET